MRTAASNSNLHLPVFQNRYYPRMLHVESSISNIDNFGNNLLCGTVSKAFYIPCRWRQHRILSEIFESMLREPLGSVINSFLSTSLSLHIFLLLRTYYVLIPISISRCFVSIVSASSQIQKVISKHHYTAQADRADWRAITIGLLYNRVWWL